MSTIADIPGDPMNSLTDPTFTFHFDKYSCIREFYYAHVFFCYIIAISGANFPEIAPFFILHDRISCVACKPCIRGNT